MKNVILKTILILIVMSCGSGDRGELVGVKGKKYFSEKPFGMALIPGGAFIMGKSDDDIAGVNNAPTKTVTVKSFYMDETEITNSEYRQFVNWVRDSIFRTKLAEITEYGLIEEGDGDWANVYAYMGLENQSEDNSDGEWNPEIEANKDKKRLNWNIELIFDENDFPSQAYRDIYKELRIDREETFNDTEIWDIKQFLFKYTESDVDAFVKMKNDGGYIYEVISDKNSAVNSLVEYLEFDQEVAETIVFSPSPVDVVSKSQAYVYEDLNTKIEEYWTENDPDNWEEFSSMEKVSYKKRFSKDYNPKDFIRSEDLQIYPDTTVWLSDFGYSYNDPMHDSYFHHDAFNDHPVVGVTWKQAKAFCAWRTMYKNGFQKTKKNKSLVPKFRLPTEAEWEYAARGGLQGAMFPWGGPYTKNDRGCFMANFKPMRGDYAVDQALYTVEGDAYDANDYGLFNMSGNVAEWVNSSYESDAYDFSSSMNPNVNKPDNKKKITRGGSWKDVKYYLQVSSRNYEYEDIPRSFIGFRTVHDYLGDDLTANAQTNSSRIKR
tara:strand:+ start:109 stop:1749 length:1641 start_codon:yes stop_codon:yes gene_type:complete